jgi:outer membrane protein assembly factor BamE (lipoprotein component of BamABCDE complex)
MRTIGPAKPEVIEREVVAVSFDSAGRVANVERFGLEQGRVVPISRRVTSSSTANKGFLRQLLGNLGRFNAGDFIGG